MLALARPAAVVALCVAAAVAYGVAHDQITARVCVEYFTVGHPAMFATDDPTLLGLGWGIIATWWMGLLLWLPLAIAARLARRPVRSLVRPVTVLMLTAGSAAMTAGIVGFLFGRAGVVALTGDLAEAVPTDRHARFLACLWAHTASYAIGVVGGLVVVVRVWRSGRRVTSSSPSASAPPAATHPPVAGPA